MLQGAQKERYPFDMQDWTDLFYIWGKHDGIPFLIQCWQAVYSAGPGSQREATSKYHFYLWRWVSAALSVWSHVFSAGSLLSWGLWSGNGPLAALTDVCVCRVCTHVPDNGAYWRSAEKPRLAALWWAARYFAPGFFRCRDAHTPNHARGCDWRSTLSAKLSLTLWFAELFSHSLLLAHTHRPHWHAQTTAFLVAVTCRETSYPQQSRELSTVARDKPTKPIIVSRRWASDHQSFKTSFYPH